MTGILTKSERQRALALLADGPDGFTEAALNAHGLNIEQLVELVTAGLATAQIERIGGGEIVRVRITVAGRQKLAALRPAARAE